jgi:hypothetical protein
MSGPDARRVTRQGALFFVFYYSPFSLKRAKDRCYQTEKAALLPNLRLVRVFSESITPGNFEHA